jgi:hypothetical protein
VVIATVGSCGDCAHLFLVVPYCSGPVDVDPNSRAGIPMPIVFSILMLLMRALLVVIAAMCFLLLWDLSRSTGTKVDRSIVGSVGLVAVAAITASFSANPWVRKFGGGVGALVAMAAFAWMLSSGYLAWVIADL